MHYDAIGMGEYIKEPEELTSGFLVIIDSEEVCTASIWSSFRPAKPGVSVTWFFFFWPITAVCRRMQWGHCSIVFANRRIS